MPFNASDLWDPTVAPEAVYLSGGQPQFALQKFLEAERAGLHAGTAEFRRISQISITCRKRTGAMVNDPREQRTFERIQFVSLPEPVQELVYANVLNSRDGIYFLLRRMDFPVPGQVTCHIYNEFGKPQPHFGYSYPEVSGKAA